MEHQLSEFQFLTVTGSVIAKPIFYLRGGGGEGGLIQISKASRGSGGMLPRKIFKITAFRMQKRVHTNVMMQCVIVFLISFLFASKIRL